MQERVYRYKRNRQGQGRLRPRLYAGSDVVRLEDVKAIRRCAHHHAVDLHQKCVGGGGGGGADVDGQMESAPAAIVVDSKGAHSAGVCL